MKHVVSFSTGLSSALTVERVYERYGPKSMVVVFMDTLIEDGDNYRFQREIYRRWCGFGIRIERLEEGRTPYEVSTDEGMISNQRRAPCTRVLKIQPFVSWLKTQTEPLTIHIGFDFSEVDRCAAVERNYGKLGHSVDFPLLWRPLEFRPYPQVCRDDWGIEPPRMYEQGYSHANCGGVCVKQGWGDWLRTLINYPQRYAVAEEWEKRMRQHPVRQNYAILRDQSNGTVTPKTLRQLREEHEAGQVGQLSLLDFDAGCVRCGVGDLA
jgi:hypothetical protein